MKVLVAVDKNPETYTGLRYACHLLENGSARVDALHVMPELADVAADSYAPFVTSEKLADTVSEEMEEVRQQFLEAAEACPSPRVSCALEVAEGDPAEEILNAAHAGNYDLLVLGAHEQSSLRGLLLGAVHAKILHHAHQPVLIVRRFREIKRVLVVYRGSETDQAALRFIAPLLANKKADITLLYVQEDRKREDDEHVTTALQKGAAILRELDYEPITKVARGEFVEEILKDVAVQRYDLVVLGAYGRTRSKYLRMISDEALNLARLTTRPILVYRSAGETDTPHGSR
jgi:nucleotide-binding universal stress UspA family protein